MKIKKIIFLFLLLFGVIIPNFTVQATPLENKIKDQEEQLKDEININTEFDIDIQGFSEALNKPSSGEVNVDTLGDGLISLLLKMRSIFIIIHIIALLLSVIYLGIMGSRSIEYRKKGMLFIISITIALLIILNLPLLIIYIQANNKKSINITEALISFLYFIRRNSFPLSAMLFYIGLTKRYLVSKNDIAQIKQGKYLMNFSVWLLIIMIVVLPAIAFIL